MSIFIKNSLLLVCTVHTVLYTQCTVCSSSLIFHPFCQVQLQFRYIHCHIILQKFWGKISSTSGLRTKNFFYSSYNLMFLLRPWKRPFVQVSLFYVQYMRSNHNRHEYDLSWYSLVQRITCKPDTIFKKSNNIYYLLFLIASVFIR